MYQFTTMKLDQLTFNYFDCKVSLLLFQIDGHERYIYNPMHYHLKPLVQRIPRRVTVRGYQLDVFTANAVTYFRTSLVIAMSLCLK